MALKLIGTVAPCYTYEPYSGSTGWYSVYHPELITPPRAYVETIDRLSQFFYDPVKDVYVAFMWLEYAFWPSWRFYCLVFNGADGSLNTTYTDYSPGIFFSAWTNHISIGGYDKFYATGNSFLDVREIDWQAGTWTGWQCYDWAGRNPPVFNQAIVNRTDTLVVGQCLGASFSVYNYETHALIGQVSVLNSFLNGYMSYENDTYFWVVFGNGRIAKINYQSLRYEMLSAIASPAPTDISYRCAFDTNRKRLAILRHQPDAADGACQVQLEFYQPVPQAQIITAPVPVNPLTAGTRITFSAHVLGDAGEGIAAKAVTATLATPTVGALTSGRLLTGSNGAVDLTYVAPTDNAAETLEVSTEI